MAGARPWLSTVLGITTHEEYDERVEEAIREAHDLKVYSNWHCVYGQVPPKRPQA